MSSEGLEHKCYGRWVEELELFRPQKRGSEGTSVLFSAP